MQLRFTEESQRQITKHVTEIVYRQVNYSGIEECIVVRCRLHDSPLSFLRGHRAFRPSAKLRDRGWWWLPLRSASSKCTPAKLECHPSKRTRSGGARCYIPPRHAAFLLPARETSLLLKREDTRGFFPSLFSEECVWIRAGATKQRNRRRCTRVPFALADQS